LELHQEARSAGQKETNYDQRRRLTPARVQR